LREAELDSRREVGLIIRESKIVKQLIDCFDSDWSSTDGATDRAMKKDEPEVPKKHIVRATKVLARELHPLAATVKKAVKKVVAEAGEDILADKRVKTTVKKIVKKAIKQAVKEAANGTKDS
jgi:ribosomal protein L17